MDKIGQNILKNFKEIEVITLLFDFSSDTSIEAYEDLYKKIEKLDISILVNAVGFTKANEFCNMSLNEVHTLMAVNCYPIALLTKQVLKSFKSRFNKDNKIRSLIINFSAGASLIPTPFVQLYSATKVYTDFLSEGLAYELKEFNVDVMTVKSYNLTNEIVLNNDKIPFFVRLATVTPE